MLRWPFVLAASSLLLLVSLAVPAHAEERDSSTRPARLTEFEVASPPPGYRIVMEHSPRRIAAGIVVASVSYAATVLMASQPTFAAEAGARVIDLWPTFVPAVGPFLGLALVDDKAPGAGNAYLGLGLAGAAQVVGFTMLAASVTFRQPACVRVDAPPAAKLQAAPLLSREVQGMGIAGTF